MQMNWTPPNMGQHIANTLLMNEDNRVFESYDMDEVRQSVGRIFKPHTLKMLKHSGEFQASMHHVQHGGVSINQLGYQNEVMIDPEQLEDFYLVQIPIRGGAEIRCGNKTFISSAQTASLVSPSLPLNMRWDADSPQIILRLEKERVERHCQQHFNLIPHKTVEFEPELHLDTTAGMHFLRMLQIMTEALTAPCPSLRYPLAFEQLQATLINALVYGQASNLPLEGPVNSIAPYFIKRVEEYIHAHAHEAMTIETLAEYAGVSVRTLFAGFHRYRETSPMEFVRQIRLQHVRSELLAQDFAAKSVTDIALKWGFNHLGRFAIDYKRRFGESPSATLRFKSK